MRVTILLSMLLAASSALAEGGVTVEVSGTGVGPTDDSACGEARKAAQRNAAEQGSGVQVVSDSTVKNTLLVRDVILTRAQGFVSGLKQLGNPEVRPVTGQANLRECTVRISATVEKDKAGDALKKVAAAYAAKGRPKVLVMVAEQSVGMSQPAAWWENGQKKEKGASYKSTNIGQVETRMMESMQQRGWSFVDPQVIEGKIKLAGPVSANPDNQQLREFGKLAAAEFVIYGFASADEPTTGDFGGGADSAVISVPSKIAVRVVATDSGEVYATYTGTATGAGFNSLKASAASFQKLSDEAVLGLERQVVDRWLNEAYGTQRVALTVKGLKDYRMLVDFKGALGGVSLVKEIAQRPYQGGEGTFDLQCEGSGEALADKLAVAQFKGYALRIDRVTPAVVEVTLTQGK